MDNSTQQLLECSNILTVAKDHIWCNECKREYMVMYVKHYHHPLAKCDLPDETTAERYHSRDDYLECNWADAGIGQPLDENGLPRYDPNRSVHNARFDDPDDERSIAICGECDEKMNAKPKLKKTRCPKCDYLGYYARVNGDKTCPACIGLAEKESADAEARREKMEARAKLRAQKQEEQAQAQKQIPTERSTDPYILIGSGPRSRLPVYLLLDVGTSPIHPDIFQTPFGEPGDYICDRVTVVGYTDESITTDKWFTHKYNWRHYHGNLAEDLDCWLRSLNRPFAWKISNEHHWLWLNHLCRDVDLGIRL